MSARSEVGYMGSQQSLAEFLIAEQLRNEALGDPPHRMLELLQGLIHQVPNRVYYNEDGEMLRALLYRGKYPYEAYFDVITPGKEEWVERKHEHLIGRTPKDIEQELSFQRRRFGMKYDLLTNPNVVFKVDNDKEKDTFIHLGVAKGEPLVSCRYYETGLFEFTPRFTAFEFVNHSKRFMPSELTLLSSPPKNIMQYAQKS